MPGMTNATKEAAAVAVTSLGNWISIHTADPGTGGSNEATGGTPAYARKQTTWTAGSADGTVTGSQVIIDVPAGTYTHIGLWSAQTGGTFIGSAAITSTTTPYQSQITLTPTYVEV